MDFSVVSFSVGATVQQWPSVSFAMKGKTFKWIFEGQAKV